MIPVMKQEANEQWSYWVYVCESIY